MNEKNQVEKTASEKQAELLIHALERAKTGGGVWLNPEGKTAPRFYPRGVAVSAFNSLSMALHSDENGYKTNEYTLFSEAKKRGESVQSKEKGVPFLWYSWNEYVNKHNADDKISREAYKALDKEHQSSYKGVRTREVRSLFNIDQTTFPFVDKKGYAQEVQQQGSKESRGTKGESDTALLDTMKDFISKMNENLVPIHLDGSGMAHYDARKDSAYIPSEKAYATTADYVQEVMKQMVSATGHPQRLAREGLKFGKTPTEDALKQELLVKELASGSKMLEMGLPAKLSEESMKQVDYWQRELKENPCLIDALEMDINKSIDMIHKAENGQKVEMTSKQNRLQTEQIKAELPKHYYVADELKGIPNKDTKEFVIIRDVAAKTADVILPAGASKETDNEIKGMNKSRISTLLAKQGYGSVSFFNTDGALGFRKDDRYFEGKEVAVAKLKNWDLKDVAKLDVSDAVKRAGGVEFDKVLMLKDDEGQWALFLKPENEPSFSIYPNKADTNKFFTTMKQGQDESMDLVRRELAAKYYAIASRDDSLKVDLFKCKESGIDTRDIERVVIFKEKSKEGEESKIMCLPTIRGEKQQPRAVTQQQWQRMWIADDMKDYKTQLAAALFADVLRKDRADAVGVGTDKNEQEAQAESKEQAQHAEFHEENEKHEEKEDQNHADYHEEKDKQQAEEKKKQEEKQKQEEAKKEEEKTIKAVTGIVKQFLDLKQKHPDALLLFRTGDFYETYKQDAEKASRILGVTLTRSSVLKDEEGKPLTMAGFPYHALDTYLPKLIRAGERVAICDQIEDPRQKIQQEAKVGPSQEHANAGVHR